MAEQGVCTFITGGARGFDTLAALAVMKLKKSHPAVRHHLFLPFPAQTMSGTGEDKQYDNLIRDQADKVVYTSNQYYRGCMHKRNRAMVDNSAACLYYLTRDHGGTAYTVQYARQKGLHMIDLAGLIHGE